MTYSKLQYVSPGTNTQETDIKVRELKSKYRKAATSIALRMKKDFQAFSWFMNRWEWRTDLPKKYGDKKLKWLHLFIFYFLFLCLFFNS